MRRLTFWEETAVAIDQVFSQVPPISKLIIAFNQFNSVALGQTQLVGTACLKIILDTSVLFMF